MKGLLERFPKKQVGEDAGLIMSTIKDRRRRGSNCWAEGEITPKQEGYNADGLNLINMQGDHCLGKKGNVSTKNSLDLRCSNLGESFHGVSVQYTISNGGQGVKDGLSNKRDEEEDAMTVQGNTLKHGSEDKGQSQSLSLTPDQDQTVVTVQGCSGHAILVAQELGTISAVQQSPNTNHTGVKIGTETGTCVNSVALGLLIKSSCADNCIKPAVLASDLQGRVQVSEDGETRVAGSHRSYVLGREEAGEQSIGSTVQVERDRRSYGRALNSDLSQEDHCLDKGSTLDEALRGTACDPHSLNSAVTVGGGSGVTTGGISLLEILLSVMQFL